MRRFRTIIVLTLATFLSASIGAAQQKMSEPYSPVVLANEIMIHAQGEEAAFIAREIGVDSNSALNYSSFVDPSGQSFNFSLNSGSMYLGQPFILTVSGTLDPSTQIWNVSASGTYGNSPWEVTSSLVPSPSPASLTRHFQTVSVDTISHNDVECGYLPNANPDIPGAWWECWYTENGVMVGAPWGGFWDPSTNSAYRVNNPPWHYSVTATGFTPGQSGGGSFTTMIKPPLTPCTNCNVFFSDLSLRGNAYQCCDGWQVSGSAADGGTSYTVANQFIPARSGSISQIDAAVGYVSGVNSFYAAVYTDNGGLPGTLLGRWDNLSSNTPFGQCCGLVTISGISGLSLTADNSYFLVLGPMNVNDTSWHEWNLNSMGATGPNLYSTDGGGTWNNRGQVAMAVFQVVGNPVP